MFPVPAKLPQLLPPAIRIPTCIRVVVSTVVDEHLIEPDDSHRPLGWRQGQSG